MDCADVAESAIPTVADDGGTHTQTEDDNQDDGIQPEPNTVTQGEPELERPMNTESTEPVLLSANVEEDALPEVLTHTVLAADSQYR